MSQLLNKMNCQKCEILLEICKQRNSVGDEIGKKIVLHLSVTVLFSFQQKTHDVCVCT